MHSVHSYACMCVSVHVLSSAMLKAGVLSVTIAELLHKLSCRRLSTQSNLTEEALSCICAVSCLSSNIRAESVPSGRIFEG